MTEPEQAPRSRGVDRVPEKLRVEKPEPRVIHQGEKSMRDYDRSGRTATKRELRKGRRQQFRQLLDQRYPWRKNAGR